MRIHGYGGGFPGDSGDKRRQRSNPEAFRQGRKEGQVVRGRLVAPAEDGLAWVAVAGHTLLARLEHLPTGGELLFRITSLYPEILLQDITPVQQLSTDPARLLAGLTEARSHLENLLGDAPAPDGRLDLTAARRRHRQLLANHPQAKSTWERIRLLTRQTNALLPPEEGRLGYVPWIFPGLSQSELLSRRIPATQGGPGFTVRLFGRTPDWGRLALVIAWQPGRVDYRLLLERPETAEAVMARVARVRFGRAELAPRCLAAAPLPSELAGGYLARLLAGQSRPFTGLRLQV